jgi:hypothetical protein
MRSLDIQDAVRGSAVETTLGDQATPCPADRVNRTFQAPRPTTTWVSDFTCVSTWRGFVDTALVIDALARRPIAEQRRLAAFFHGPLFQAPGRLRPRSREQALHDRSPVRRDGLIRHSDPSGASWPFRLPMIDGVPYVSIRYTERLAEAGLKPSVGSVGDSFDNDPPRPAGRVSCRDRSDGLLAFAGRTGHRPPQDRDDPPPQSLAKLASRGPRHPRMGSLVQPPPAARARRSRPASQGRNRVLWSSEEPTHRSVGHKPTSLRQTRGGSHRRRRSCPRSGATRRRAIQRRAPPAPTPALAFALPARPKYPVIGSLSALVLSGEPAVPRRQVSAQVRSPIGSSVGSSSTDKPRHHRVRGTRRTARSAGSPDAWTVRRVAFRHCRAACCRRAATAGRPAADVPPLPGGLLPTCRHCGAACCRRAATAERPAADVPPLRSGLLPTCRHCRVACCRRAATAGRPAADVPPLPGGLLPTCRHRQAACC